MPRWGRLEIGGGEAYWGGLRFIFEAQIHDQGLTEGSLEQNKAAVFAMA
jgi:hypothetical protein